MIVCDSRNTITGRFGNSAEEQLHKMRWNTSEILQDDEVEGLEMENRDSLPLDVSLKAES
jgi:hypothetical protein